MMRPPTEPRPRSSPRLLAWPVLILLFWVPSALWALASPVFSVPDEPSHVVKAVALWHGQLDGRDVVRPDQYLETTFQLPLVWAQSGATIDCYKFRADTTAACAPPFAGSQTIGDVTTTAGHYPPLFYALVGWGGRLDAGPAGLVLMRITSALLCAVALAAAVRALATVVDARLALGATLVAATPVLAFLAGSVNPNGLEAAAAAATWATAIAVARWPDRDEGPVPTALVVQLVVAGTVTAFTRGLSPVLVIGILVLAATAARPRQLVEVLHQRTVAVGTALVGLASILAMALVLTSGALTSTPGRVQVTGQNLGAALVGPTDQYVTEMIGVFGWLDTKAPSLVFHLWLGAAAGLILLALALAPLRRSFGVLAAVAATLALPIVAQYPGAAAQGLPWQGRYSLPVAVGIPLMAVAVIGTRHDIAGLARRVGLILAAGTGLGSVVAFAWTLRRYAVGIDGGFDIFGAPWQPPLGSLALVLAMSAFAAATVAMAWFLRPPPARSSSQGLATVAGG